MSLKGESIEFNESQVMGEEKPKEVVGDSNVSLEEERRRIRENLMGKSNLFHPNLDRKSISRIRLIMDTFDSIRNSKGRIGFLDEEFEIADDPGDKINLSEENELLVEVDEFLKSKNNTELELVQKMIDLFQKREDEDATRSLINSMLNPN